MEHQGTGVHNTLFSEGPGDLRIVMFIDPVKEPSVSVRETSPAIGFSDIFTCAEAIRKLQASFLCQTEKNIFEWIYMIHIHTPFPRYGKIPVCSRIN